MQTAEILAGALNLTVVPEPRLQEYDFGDAISGLTWDAIREQHPEIIQALGREDSDFPRYPGEEGRAIFGARVSEAMGEIVARHPEGTVAIVTHAGPIVAYVLESLGRPYRRPVPFSIDNASITTLEVNEPRSFAPSVVTAINDTCHWRLSD
jgi:probable phosphoglycerate mutase